MPRRLIVRFPGHTTPRIPRRWAALAGPCPWIAAIAGGLALGALAPDVVTRLVDWRTAGAASAPAAGPAAAVHAQTGGSGGPTYALPLANFFGEDDVCESWIAVQNVGDRPGQPVAVYMTDRPEGTPTPTITPEPWRTSLKYEFACGGLLRPGSAWDFVGAQVATGSRSGFILSIDGATLTAAGADASGGDDVQGGRLCQLLKERIVGNAAAWRRFYAAWRSGGAWEGLPLGRLAGPPLSVVNFRSCPGQKTPGVDVVSAFEAPRLERAAPGRHRAAIAPIGRSDRSLPVGWRIGGQIHVQNVGAEAGTFTLRFQRPGACAPLPIAQTVVLQPGDEVDLDRDLAPADVDALAVVEGDQPFVAFVQPALDDWSTSRTVASRPAGDSAPAARTLAAVLPLYPGTTRVSVDIVNNCASAVAPRLTLYGPEGRVGPPVLAPVVGAALCPGALATLSVTMTLAAGPPRTHLVWVDADSAGADASLGATVGVTGLAAAGQGDAVRHAYRVEARSANGGAALSETPPLALPAAYDDVYNSGIQHVVAVARTGAQGGRWDFAVDLYDHNGRTDRHCATLSAAAGDVVDLADLALAAPGSKASAIVSSVAFAGGGAPGDVVATDVWLRGTLAAADDVPGDEWAAVAGAPVGAEWRAGAAGAACGPVAEPAPPGPPDSAPLRAIVFTPAAGYIGQDALCAAEVTITNHGAVPAAIVRIAWGEPGFCEPDCAAPMAVGCLPLIAPGASFTFIESAPSNSGVFLSVSAGTLADLGLRPGDTRTGADVLCADAALAGTCDAWRQLWLSWQLGGTYADLPFGRLVGPPITAEVKRTCRAGAWTPAAGPASYAAPTGADALAAETRPDRFVYGVTDLTLPKPGARPVTDTVFIYIQNAGMRCAGVDLTFVAASGAVTRCDILTLSAGESYQLEISDCLDGAWQGDAIIASNAPLAIAVDRHVNPLTSGGALPGAPPPIASPGATPSTTPAATPAATSTAMRAGGRVWLPLAIRK